MSPARQTSSPSSKTVGTSRRGILSLINTPLHYFPFDEEALLDANNPSNLKPRRRRRRKKEAAEAVSNLAERGQNSPFHQGMSDPSVTGEKEYDPATSEFTLFYFAESGCLNSIRFTPKLARFVRDRSEACQCVCVPNDAINEQAESVCRGTGFYCLPFYHANRAAIIRLLSVSMVPTVVVVNNSTGSRITDHGMQAIDMNRDGAVEAWRSGGSGVALLGMAGCVLS